jgi:flagellum-specific peptidoglycan hydrolase FlgJ
MVALSFKLVYIKAVSKWFIERTKSVGGNDEVKKRNLFTVLVVAAVSVGGYIAPLTATIVQASDSQISSTSNLVVPNKKIGPGYYDASRAFLQSNGAAAYRANALTSPSTFLNQIKAGAISAWKKYKVLPSITAAQAAAESSWGTSQLATQGNNLFGIKGNYNGQSVTMPTQEYQNGQWVTVYAQFRKYPNLGASMEDHGVFLNENPRYANVLGNRDYAQVARLLQQDGYGTDPNYATKLINIIEEFGLQAWDQEAFSGTQVDDSVVTVKYVPGYGVMAFNKNGSTIAGSNTKFKDGTSWKTFGSTVINGEEMYDVGAAQFLPKRYTNVYDDVLTINYAPGYGVNAVHGNGEQYLGSNTKFKTGTRWKIVGVKEINGSVAYAVGTDTYIMRQYSQWGSGK